MDAKSTLAQTDATPILLTASSKNCCARWQLIPPVFQMGIILAGLLVLHFQLMRLVLLWSAHDLTADVRVSELVMAFLVGLRFDIATTAYFMFALFPLLCITDATLGQRAARRACLLFAAAVWAPLTLLGLAEVEFYREFFCRYNSLALNYWEQPGTVLSMIWNGYPVIKYSLVCGLWVAIVTSALHFATKHLKTDRGILTPRQKYRECGIGLIAVALLVVAARGGVRGVPLDWGDAIHGSSTFANHLSQNGLWSLGKSAQLLFQSRDPLPEIYPHQLSEKIAQQQLQHLLNVEGDRWSSSDHYPALRTASPPASENLPQPLTTDAPNVVIILMESFSARFCGACGADQSGDDYTPQFNQLAKQGVLFNRCFSAGTHTHQANFATVCGVPNLPGHESLMNDNTLGAQPLDSLPRALKARGYQTMYLYNGDLAWENMEGFYRQQGIDQFVQRNDFAADSEFDCTWGVSDGELFKRANAEFKQLRQPFFATICTLSNHEPFDLPRPLPVPEVTDQGSMNKRLTGIRYADWAIGQFFSLARKESYFKNTLFVLVGDHGFSIAPIITDLRLLRFHVPLLFYAPNLLGSHGRVEHRVASQVDVTPTVLGLIGNQSPHQHWGRNLFALDPSDEGWAYFKPSEFGEQIGFASGDWLLVKAGKGRTQLYRYSLGFPASAQLVNDSQVTATLDRTLHAYVQLATESLVERRMLAADSYDRPNMKSVAGHMPQIRERTSARDRP